MGAGHTLRLLELTNSWQSGPKWQVHCDGSSASKYKSAVHRGDCSRRWTEQVGQVASNVYNLFFDGCETKWKFFMTALNSPFAAEWISSILHIVELCVYTRGRTVVWPRFRYPHQRNVYAHQQRSERKVQNCCQRQWRVAVALLCENWTVSVGVRTGNNKKRCNERYRCSCANSSYVGIEIQNQFEIRSRRNGATQSRVINAQTQ